MHSFKDGEGGPTAICGPPGTGKTFILALTLVMLRWPAVLRSLLRRCLGVHYEYNPDAFEDLMELLSRRPVAAVATTNAAANELCSATKKLVEWLEFRAAGHNVLPVDLPHLTIVRVCDAQRTFEEAPGLVSEFLDVHAARIAARKIQPVLAATEQRNADYKETKELRDRYMVNTWASYAKQLAGDLKPNE